MSIEFEDNTVKIMDALADNLSAFMHEIGGEITEQARRIVRVDTGKTKGSYDYKVRESAMAGEAEVQIGSDMENAIWEECGTGEYALHGDGRKGGWYIPEEKLTENAKSKMKKVIGKNGKVYYYTRGKKPVQPLKKAFEKTEPKIQKQMVNIAKESIGGGVSFD